MGGETGRDVRERWERIAPFWDDYMGAEGNRFHRELVAPAAERLLALTPGETVLEVACGAGLFARRMAELGTRVVATDFSAPFLERAAKRVEGQADRVELRLVDAADEAALLALGERRFDAAVANMALMDMAEIGPLFRALSRLLKPGGRFVFTVCHPCFNAVGTSRIVEERPTADGVAVTHAIKVTQYLGARPAEGVGIVGQPVSQWYFDRPLHVLFNEGFRAGFVVDGLEEPSFTATDDRSRPTAQDRFAEFPMVLAVRMRVGR